MADLNITASDVQLAEGAAGVGTLSAAVDAGDVIQYDSDAGTWGPASDTVEATVRVAIALASGAAGQTIALASTDGDELVLGSVLTPGEIYIISSNAGRIAPHGDLSIAGGDQLFILGYAKTATTLVFTPIHTGVT
jgi:hypothetical protein